MCVTVTVRTLYRRSSCMSGQGDQREVESYLAELFITAEWRARVCRGQTGGIENVQDTEGQKSRREHLRLEGIDSD